MPWLSGLWVGINAFYDRISPEVHPYNFSSLALVVIFGAATVLRIAPSTAAIRRRLLEKHGKQKYWLYSIPLKILNALIAFTVAIMVADATEHNLAVGLTASAVLFGGWEVIVLLSEFWEKKSKQQCPRK